MTLSPLGGTTRHGRGMRDRGAESYHHPGQINTPGEAAHEFSNVTQSMLDLDPATCDLESILNVAMHGTGPDRFHATPPLSCAAGPRAFAVSIRPIDRQEDGEPAAAPLYDGLQVRNAPVAGFQVLQFLLPFYSVRDPFFTFRFRHYRSLEGYSPARETTGHVPIPTTFPVSIVCPGHDFELLSLLSLQHVLHLFVLQQPGVVVAATLLPGLVLGRDTPLRPGLPVDPGPPLDERQYFSGKHSPRCKQALPIESVP